MFLGFRFTPCFRHENWLPTSFWSLSLGLLLMALVFSVPACLLSYSQVLKLSGDACGHASLIMPAWADLNVWRNRDSHPSSLHLTNKADITCQLFWKETFQAHMHGTHCFFWRWGEVFTPFWMELCVVRPSYCFLARSVERKMAL